MLNTVEDAWNYTVFIYLLFMWKRNWLHSQLTLTSGFIPPGPISSRFLKLPGSSPLEMAVSGSSSCCSAVVLLARCLLTHPVSKVLTWITILPLIYKTLVSFTSVWTSSFFTQQQKEVDLQKSKWGWRCYGQWGNSEFDILLCHSHVFRVQFSHCSGVKTAPLSICLLYFFTM